MASISIIRILRLTNTQKWRYVSCRPSDPPHDHMAGTIRALQTDRLHNQSTSCAICGSFRPSRASPNEHAHHGYHGCHNLPTVVLLDRRACTLLLFPEYTRIYASQNDQPDYFRGSHHCPNVVVLDRRACTILFRSTQCYEFLGFTFSPIILLSRIVLKLLQRIKVVLAMNPVVGATGAARKHPVVFSLSSCLFPFPPQPLHFGPDFGP